MLSCLWWCDEKKRSALEQNNYKLYLSINRVAFAVAASRDVALCLCNILQSPSSLSEEVLLLLQT